MQTHVSSGQDRERLPPTEILRSQLDQQLIRAIVLWMILLGTPFNFVFGLALWREVTVLQRYPMAAFVNHIVGCTLTFGLGSILLWLGKNRGAMVAIIASSIGHVFVQMWTMEDTTIFAYVSLPLVLPAIVLSARTMSLILAAACTGLVALVQLNPVLERNAADWISGMATTVAITASLMALGGSIRRVLDNFAAAIVAREDEAVARARLEERTVLLEEHQQRLLAAQHDLRGPCITLSRTAQMIQDGAFDSSTFCRLLPQIEILATRLRTRMDALFDEAKAPRLEAQQDLPLIDLASIIEEHLPELRRQTALASSVQVPANEPPTIVFETCGGTCSICGRIDELQRILENLVLNSAAAKAQQIRVLVRSAETGTELLVEDDGVGFPEWMLETPFRPMNSRRRGGTGLGLVGVKANVEAFHGKLAIENWQNGARVRMFFPCGI